MLAVPLSTTTYINPGERSKRVISVVELKRGGDGTPLQAGRWKRIERVYIARPTPDRNSYGIPRSHGRSLIDPVVISCSGHRVP